MWAVLLLLLATVSANEIVASGTCFILVSYNNNTARARITVPVGNVSFVLSDVNTGTGFVSRILHLDGFDILSPLETLGTTSILYGAWNSTFESLATIADYTVNHVAPYIVTAPANNATSSTVTWLKNKQLLVGTSVSALHVGSQITLEPEIDIVLGTIYSPPTRKKTINL